MADRREREQSWEEEVDQIDAEPVKPETNRLERLEARLV